MTKRVRIENADISSFKVAVDIYDRGYNGQPDVLVETRVLNTPTDLIEVYIHDGHYLVIRELT